MGVILGKDASRVAVELIEQQLQMLPVAIATILRPTEIGDVDPELVRRVLKRKQALPKTGSGGNIVARYADGDNILDFHASNKALHDDQRQQMRFLRMVISNAILAVGMFFREHEMAEVRIPEVQFLGRVVDAILNLNTFQIDTDYIPKATFDGLVIDARLNGSPVFGDGSGVGLMEFGDGVALLQWLSRYLRGEKNFVSGGDAG
jgi:hypothetical protein